MRGSAGLLAAKTLVLLRNLKALRAKDTRIPATGGL
jgi:hypothetical protein